ncbi:FKBP-type peptidyl-prolyl cis-trans isomerase [Pedobacter sp. MW01-1-1]|uniref:FKBP-type peptidyl-prolyl cis-trans isomerase n=1 Tax=Pedobacter sp. MW01-1-1 TaxID=3383027 RepID=UPI003FEF5687
MNKIYYFGCFLILVFSFNSLLSCKKEYQSIENLDDENIQKYIKANNLTMTKAPNGSYYLIIAEGTSEVFKNTDSVLFTFTEKSMADGTFYYSTNANGNAGNYYGYFSEFYSGTWGVSLNGHRAGAKVRILIPSHLAYGKNGRASGSWNLSGTGLLTANVPSNAIIGNYITTSVYNKQALLDNERIQNYLTTNKITAQVDPSGINYIVETLGTGDKFNPETAKLILKFTNRLLDGTVLSVSTDGTYSIKIEEAAVSMVGWKIMLPKFSVGTKFRMFISSNLANNSNGQPTTPQNAVLDCYMEIVSATN